MTVSPQIVQELIVRRQIAELQGIRRRRNRRVPTQIWPKGIELLYTKVLREYQNYIEDAIRKILYPQLQVLVPQIHPDRPIILDADEDDLDRAMQHVQTQYLSNTSIILATQIPLIGRKINLFQQTQFQKQVKSVLGIDLLRYEPWLEPYLEAARKSNIALITKMTNEELSTVEGIVRNGQRQGTRVEVMRDQIKERMKISKSRAMLIARDQTGKINGEITQLRQTGLGITEYTWRMSQDERVRGNPTGLYPKAIPSHWAREGIVYQWDKPPEGGHPGEAIMCRCNAEPVFNELLLAA